MKKADLTLRASKTASIVDKSLNPFFTGKFENYYGRSFKYFI